MKYNNLDELVRDYLENDPTIDNVNIMLESYTFTIEDFIPSGQYKEFPDGAIIVY